jgi:hypothetical protein
LNIAWLTIILYSETIIVIKIVIIYIGRSVYL